MADTGLINICMDFCRGLAFRDVTVSIERLLTTIIIIIKPRLTRHMSVTKEDESQARGHEIVYG